MVKKDRYELPSWATQMYFFECRRKICTMFREGEDEWRHCVDDCMCGDWECMLSQIVGEHLEGYNETKRINGDDEK